MPNQDLVMIRLAGSREHRESFIAEMKREFEGKFLAHDDQDHAYIQYWSSHWEGSFVARNNLEEFTCRHPSVKMEILVTTDHTDMHYELVMQDGQWKLYAADYLGEIPTEGVPLLGDDFHRGWPGDVMDRLADQACRLSLGADAT